MSVVERVLAAAEPRTRDLGLIAATAEMTAAVIAALDGRIGCFAAHPPSDQSPKPEADVEGLRPSSIR